MIRLILRAALLLAIVVTIVELDSGFMRQGEAATDELFKSCLLKGMNAFWSSENGVIKFRCQNPVKRVAFTLY